MKLAEGKVTGDRLLRRGTAEDAERGVAAGERGVRRVLEVFRAELELATALAGCPTVAAIAGSLVTTRR